jgi:fatty-acyl-CoA synthase
MAVILAPQPLDLEALSAHVRTELPSYAIPLFLRFQTEVEITGTFKYRKVDLVKAGFDPAFIADPMVWMNPETRRYEPLTPEVYATIQRGDVRY